MTEVGPVVFDPPISTSNLVQPDRATFLRHARAAFEGAPVVETLERRLAIFHGTAHCIAVCNGFWGLVLAIRATALPGRTDLLMPSLTYRRMADVAAWAKLRPRFCEVDPESLAASPATMRQAATPDVALLLAVHPIVGTCDAPGLEAFAASEGLPLLFDSVESVLEHVGGRKVGGFGAAECFSLHASKLLNGFEGGYVTTNDPRLAATLARLRDGTGADGFDARLNAIHAALALASLDDLPDQVERNRRRFVRYERQLPAGLRLLPFAERDSFKTVVVEVLDGFPQTRDEVVRWLNGVGILARAYYHPPLHAKPMAYPHVAAALPETDRLAGRFLLLPCGHHVSDEAIDQVSDLLREIA